MNQPNHPFDNQQQPAPPDFRQDLSQMGTGITSAATDSHEYQYAGFWVRLFAYLIDGLLLLIVTLPLTVWQRRQYASMPVEEIPSITMPDLLLSFLGAALVIWFWVKKGATPGKMLFGLQVLDDKTGHKITVKQAIFRYLGYIVSGIVLCLGYLWIGFDKKKQGWHDKIAKTVVVKKAR